MTEFGPDGTPKHKRPAESFADFVLAQLDELPNLTARRMFGGHGLYASGVFFAILSGGKLYFKVTEATRGMYESHGMGPFQPNPRQCLKSYYEVPVSVLENPEDVTSWAKASLKALRDLSS